MSKLRLALRLIAIRRTLMRHGLDALVWQTHLLRPLAWLRGLLPRRKARDDLGVRLRLCLEELGPIFVKFGQAVSTRRDLLPRPVADELAKLQDDVPPFPASEALGAIERAFGRTADQIYARFEPEPLAAASIAQVHAAELPSGEKVVVKILRPGVHAKVARDVELLYAIARLAERYSGDVRRLRPVEVVAEFEKTLDAELDLLREAANASQLKRNFAGSDKLYVPDVYWDYCRRGVLTMERISGVPISDVETLEARHTNIERLARNGVEIFFTQVFVHNFFHADMHPGNIFVDTEEPERPRYVAVDFGIVGSLSERDQLYLAQNFLAFFQRDYRRVAQLHVDSGWVPPGTRVTELEGAVRAVCEPIFDKPLKEISFGLVLVRLFETARQFDMQVQPQLVLLEKTLLAIEGLGRQLYPELDLWRTAKPILERWMRQRTSLPGQLRRLAAQWPQISEDLLLLPDVLHRVVLELTAEPASRAPANAAAEPARRRAISVEALLGAVLAIGAGAWLYLAMPLPAAAWAAVGAGVALLVGRLWRH